MVPPPVGVTGQRVLDYVAITDNPSSCLSPVLYFFSFLQTSRAATSRGSSNMAEMMERILGTERTLEIRVDPHD